MLVNRHPHPDTHQSHARLPVFLFPLLRTPILSTHTLHHNSFSYLISKWRDSSSGKFSLMPLSYYLTSTVRGGVSNTICLRVCLSVFPQNWLLSENRSLVPRPGLTPGRLCRRKKGCRQPSPELRAGRQAGSTSRPGAPSTQHPRIRRRPRGCPGVAGRAPGGLPTKRWGTWGRPCRPCTLRGLPPGAGPGIEARSRASRPRDALSARPSPCGPPPLVSPPQNLSEFQWLRMEQGGPGTGKKEAPRSGGEPAAPHSTPAPA